MLTKSFDRAPLGRLSDLRKILRLGSFLLFLAIITVISAPNTAAARYSSIVTDAESGQVLYARHADTQRYPASLTKMMTLYMTFDALESGKLKLDQKLPVSKRAQGMPPSKLGLKAGETITVREAILALVTKSANDVAVVIAEALGGTEVEFAKKMTVKARDLGMTRSAFRNASGLHNRHQVSTARDMARLANALLRDHKKHYHYFSTKTFNHRGRKYRNHNSLLRYYEGTDGIKTGYIRASGFNLVASAERNGRRIIGVVFGGRSSRTRDAHMKTLMERGFKALKRAVLVELGPPRRNPLRLRQSQQIAVAPTKNQNLSLDPLVAEALAEGDTTPPPLDAWGVQVGAFSNYAPARLAATQAARRLPDILLQTRPFIEPVGITSGSLYRAQLIGLTEPNAREACRRLREMRHSCVVVPPQTAGLLTNAAN
ncbi:MAG: D-alanyl-D-alanine carboxypeptidase [Kiloniellales bacterium]|nr:D-alanyl-D-alanine carboxypeptidase [Kiloniellales bacterium]